MALDFRSLWISKIAFLREKFLPMHLNLLCMLKVNILGEIVLEIICLSLCTCTWWRKEESLGILLWNSSWWVHFPIQKSSKKYHYYNLFFIMPSMWDYSVNITLVIDSVSPPSMLNAKARQKTFESIFFKCCEKLSWQNVTNCTCWIKMALNKLMYFCFFCNFQITF